MRGFAGALHPTETARDGDKSDGGLTLSVLCLYVELRMLSDVFVIVVLTDVECASSTG